MLRDIEGRKEWTKKDMITVTSTMQDLISSSQSLILYWKSQNIQLSLIEQRRRRHKSTNFGYMCWTASVYTFSSSSPTYFLKFLGVPLLQRNSKELDHHKEHGADRALLSLDSRSIFEAGVSAQICTVLYRHKRTPTLCACYAAFPPTFPRNLSSVAAGLAPLLPVDWQWQSYCWSSSRSQSHAWVLPEKFPHGVSLQYTHAHTHTHTHAQSKSMCFRNKI